jgi:DNA helicase-2/ATP-dependent DNA helicase PcrA
MENSNNINSVDNVNSSLISIESILQKLNPPQLEATTTINGAVQVIAGAGSGKTRVLTTRIAYLITQGIKPYQILALTFTNKAAREMKERIANFVGSSLAEKIWAGTFHSIFARILRYEAELLGYSKNFSIYDQDDSNSLVKEILRELKLQSKEYQPNQIHSYISKLKNNLVSPEEYQQEVKSQYHKNVAEVYFKYQELLKTNNAMDFDDLLLNTLDLLTGNKEILEKYQKQFKYILVDEFQDTNRPQYLIVNNLSKAHSNIFIVGDDAQSIYRWRGAEIRNILDFKNDYPMCKMIRLEQNYRSTSNILDAAHSIIEHNKNQIKKKLWTENEKGDLIDVIEAEDENNEGEKIANQIIKLVEDGFNYEGIAVLYRTNAQSLVLERSLRLRNIPYQVFGGLSFYQRKEIKDVVSYLRLLINPHDSVSLLRILNEPPRGIGRASLDHIIEYANTRDISLFEAFLYHNEITNLQSRAHLGVQNFIDLIKKYQEALDYYALDSAIPDFIQETGLLDMYKEIDSDETNDRWNNVMQLINDIIRFARENPNLSLNDYLQQVSLLTDFDVKDFVNGRVALMTLHTAKGLEFPAVFITGLEKGLFPIIRNRLSPEEEEEERRLFYVGITRAKKKLCLSYARRRSRFGEYQNQLPSNFISEIHQDYLNFIGKLKNTNSYSQNQYKSNSFLSGSDSKSGNRKYFTDEERNTSYSQLLEDETFHTGELVQHSHFGEGRIVGVMGSGQNMKITVDFKSVGRKQLMAAFAKLTKVKY